MLVLIQCLSLEKKMEIIIKLKIIKNNSMEIIKKLNSQIKMNNNYTMES